VLLESAVVSSVIHKRFKGRVNEPSDGPILREHQLEFFVEIRWNFGSELYTRIGVGHGGLLARGDETGKVDRAYII
jgi:hypothetical protein